MQTENDFIEQQIDRVVDTQGLSYADAREQVLGTTRVERMLGDATVRKVISKPDADAHPELDFEWDDSNKK